MRTLANFAALALTALLLLDISTAQEEIGCFVQGECLNSHLLAVTPVVAPEQCLEVCLVSLLIFENLCFRMHNNFQDFQIIYRELKVVIPSPTLPMRMPVSLGNIALNSQALPALTASLEKQPVQAESWPV